MRTAKPDKLGGQTKHIFHPLLLLQRKNLVCMQSTYKGNPNSQTITVSSVKEMIFQGSDHCREAASPLLPNRKLEQTQEGFY